MTNRIMGAVAPLVVLLGALAACSPASRAEAPGEPARDHIMPAPGLAASLQAESSADSVRFHLRVTNASDAAVDLTFPTGQSFDFVVVQNGRELWRWSNDRMFTQAIREERLAPGDTREYSAGWSPPAGVRGQLEVHAVLTAMEHRLEQRTQFRVP